jgi:hypothetical protein
MSIGAVIIGQGGKGSSGGSGGTVNQGTPGLITAPWFVELSNGSAALGTVTNPLIVSGDETQYTDQTPETAGAFLLTVAGLYNGTEVVGLRGDSSNNLYVDLHTAIPTGSNLIGQVEISNGTQVIGIAGTPLRIDPVGTTVQPVSFAPETSGGLSSAVSQALTTSTNIKATAGQFYGFDWFNPNAVTVYIFVYNTTTLAPAIGGTTNLVYQKGLPAGAGSNWLNDFGIPCSNGITIAVSTSATSTGTPGTGLVLTTLYE